MLPLTSGRLAGKSVEPVSYTHLGYMDGDDDTGRATGVSFDELGEAVRTANADNPTEAEQRLSLIHILSIIV